MKYACFLSYRRVDNDKYNQNIRQLLSLLEEFLAPKIAQYNQLKPIFFDEDELVTGYALSDLSASLNHSACLLGIYIPDYFNEKKYAGREYMLLSQLEEKRGKALGQELRLLYTIIYDGDPKELPKQLTDRLYFNISEELISSRWFTKTAVRKKMSDISKKIVEHLKLFSQEEAKLASIPVPNFPSEAEFAAWFQAKTTMKKKSLPSPLRYDAGK